MNNPDFIYTISTVMIDLQLELNKTTVFSNLFAHMVTPLFHKTQFLKNGCEIDS